MITILPTLKTCYMQLKIIKLLKCNVPNILLSVRIMSNLLESQNKSLEFPWFSANHFAHSRCSFKISFNNRIFFIRTHVAYQHIMVYPSMLQKNKIEKTLLLSLHVSFTVLFLLQTNIRNICLCSISSTESFDLPLSILYPDIPIFKYGGQNNQVEVR